MTRYDQTRNPPAPVVDIVVRWGAREEPARGILDTGADFTQLPESVVLAMRLPRISDRTIRTASGQTYNASVHVAHLEFEGLSFRNIAIVSSPLSIALVGRDLLNGLFAEFDGPGTAFTLIRR